MEKTVYFSRIIIIRFVQYLTSEVETTSEELAAGNRSAFVEPNELTCFCCSCLLCNRQPYSGT